MKSYNVSLIVLNLSAKSFIRVPFIKTFSAECQKGVNVFQRYSVGNHKGIIKLHFIQQ